MIFAQTEYEIRCEWGAQGVAQLAPRSDVVIIVDVFSFSTCIDIAAARGALVFPFASYDERAHAFAKANDAELAAARRSQARYTLSPTSLLQIPRGTRLVLPSPNGAALSLATGDVLTLTGCLRNARAVAHAAKNFGRRIALIPAGERWGDGSLRPALEDWLGAGAILNELDGKFSPEARAARDAFSAVQSEIADVLAHCVSGKELRAKDFARDVQLAGEWNVSDTVPVLRDGAYCSLM